MAQGATDVLLVSLPFTSLQYPSLGASLLATALHGRNIPCDLHYLAFDFAEAIGLENYLLLSHESFYQAFLGEWIFSELVFARPDALDIEYLTQVLPDFAEPMEAVFLTNLALQARKAAAGFIANAADAIAAKQPQIVGVTTSFQQNLASIAFAQALKERLPETTILFGGANCEAELGQQLLASFDSIDAVCSGEGDVSFLAFVEQFQSDAPLPEVPGITTRASPSGKAPGGMVTALDDLPIPDFDDFYARFDQTPGLSDLLNPAPTIETSRGCWWGAKHHCTFCGLNGNAMAYRSKTPERAFAEFQSQAAKYGSDFVVVDNILDYAYFDSLLPMLRDDEAPYLMHYEVKSNLFPKHIKAMAEAGIRKIQPGIETLDSHILKLMKKGVSAQQNVQTLKLCAQAGIYVDWGFIYGFPGEDPAAYDAMAALIPFLHHLNPPAAFAPVRADRFSPYYTKPETHGVTLAPTKPYQYIYAGTGEDLSKFSYHHHMLDAGLEMAKDYTRSAGEAVGRWRAGHEDAEFYIAADDGTQMALMDSRGGGAAERIDLTELESHIVRTCACIIAQSRIIQDLTPRFTEESVTQAIGDLVRRGVLMKEGRSLLALPLQVGAHKQAPAWEVIRAEALAG